MTDDEIYAAKLHWAINRPIPAEVVDTLADECLRLKALFREISEPDGDDPRLDYVTVQIDKTAYREMMEAKR